VLELSVVVDSLAEALLDAAAMKRETWMTSMSWKIFATERHI